MRKSDKKKENQLRIALTQVCDTALKNFNGFEWLTHTVNYNNFPHSLQIVCIFDTNDNLSRFVASPGNHQLSKLVQEKIFTIDINLKNITNHLSFDTEENCTKNHNGKWGDRLG